MKQIFSEPWKPNVRYLNIKGRNLNGNNAPLTYHVSTWLKITNIK